MNAITDIQDLILYITAIRNFYQGKALACVKAIKWRGGAMSLMRWNPLRIRKCKCCWDIFIRKRGWETFSPKCMEIFRNRNSKSKVINTSSKDLTQLKAEYEQAKIAYEQALLEQLAGLKE